jgi:RimJ/RimL family protein N-acetyltransferase
MTSPNRSINFDAGIQYSPVDETSAREFLNWKYDHPYENYNYSPENYERDLAYHIDPTNNLYTMRSDNKLVGYCSFGRDAQVPGGDYSEDALDIGMMLKPELTGQGFGGSFVANVVQQAITKYNPRKLRVTILEINQRAMKVWEKNGFRKKQAFESLHNQTRFGIFTRDA